MVTWRNRPHAPAPSIADASYISSGMAWRAARSVMAKNGMPHQTLATIGPHKASRGSPRMLSGAARMPSAASQWGRGPITGLNSQAKVRPERKLGTAHGTNTSACTTRRPANGSAQQQRQAEAERELEQQRGEGPLHRVAEGVPEHRVAKDGLEVGEADPAALERVQELELLEGVGHAHDQRHQHQQREQHQRRAQVGPGLEPGKAPPRAPPARGGRDRPLQCDVSHFFWASVRNFAHSSATSLALRRPSSASCPPWIEIWSAKKPNSSR